MKIILFGGLSSRKWLHLFFSFPPFFFKERNRSISLRENGRTVSKTLFRDGSF